ncbi:MAG TPA: helix-turn-helix domain-containing protein [Thermoanaerobaculia bacterium]|nr:helix-turn-helix domain-containing protein [Thermoanaerobaculia bacterium]
MDIDEATRICARLLREGSVPRAEIPMLDAPEVHGEVERRLRSVGLTLATSPSSDHVGLRLAPEVTADAGLDAASHLGLRPEACALLVILWVRLVLQKRTGGTEPPRVHLETLVRDFQPVLGGRSRIRSLVQELRRLRFLAGSGEEIEAAPLLELAIDGERIMGFLRRDVLAGLGDEPEHGTEPAGQPVTESPAGLGAQVLETIERLGGTATMGDLSRLTNAPASRLRRILHDLQNAGWVRRTGERAGTRYHLARRSPRVLP